MPWTHFSLSLGSETGAEVESDGRYPLIKPLPKVQYIPCHKEFCATSGWPIWPVLVTLWPFVFSVGWAPTFDRQTDEKGHVLDHPPARLPDRWMLRAWTFLVFIIASWWGSGVCPLGTQATQSRRDLRTHPLDYVTSVPSRVKSGSESAFG